MANEIQTLDPLTIGIDRIYDCKLYQADSPTTAITTYTDSATFTASFYRGDDQASLFSPTCAWISASAGTFSVTFPSTSTDDLTEGVYRLDVFITENSIKSHAVRASIEVIATAGSGTAPATYCSYEDMLLWAPFIRDLVDSQEDQAGFAEQRGQARKWLDNIAQRHYRENGRYSNRQTSLDHLLGFGFTRGEISTQLKTWLDDNDLILDPDVVACVAHYAISLVLRRTLTGQKSQTTDYSSYAAHFAAEANARAASLVLRIDTTSTPDGVPDVFINLGVTDTLYA